MKVKMKIKNTKVYGLGESIIRSGFPMQVGEPGNVSQEAYEAGLYKEEVPEVNENSKDIKRASKLAHVPTGSGHDNYMKGIIVQFDVQFPEFWSSQMQRYTWMNIISSQSKMHKITSRELDSTNFTSEVWPETIERLNKCVAEYNTTTDVANKSYLFRQIIENLPSGYLKWMGITCNYLQLKTVYKQRRNHKLTEWLYFCDWVETLPMAHLITG